MLSLFLRAAGRVSKDPASRLLADKDAEPHSKAESTVVQMETATAAAGEAPARDLSALVSDIVANAEFLEVVYGENQYLKNILRSAGEAKRHLQDA